MGRWYFSLSQFLVFHELLRSVVAAPYALHQLVVVDTAGDAVIRLNAYDTVVPSNKMTYTVTSSPSDGSLHQLSQVFSDYGYEPKAGTQISSSAVVTGSKKRVYYKRPSPDVASVNKWDTFTFTASDGSEDSTVGTITIVPPSGALVGDNFLLGNGGWTITGNKATTDAIHESFSRGPLLNYYLYGIDDKVNVATSGTDDASLWYFEAPSRYLGNQGIAYGGYLKFTLGAFSGDFSKMNGNDTSMVILECATCQGPVTTGITLAYPISAYSSEIFDGEPMTFTIPLVEGHGWTKDPQNTLLEWSDASKCDVIQVLSRLSGLRILGDWTRWYESVAIDNVQIYNTRGNLPICAQSKNDASVCTC